MRAVNVNYIFRYVEMEKTRSKEEFNKLFEDPEFGSSCYKTPAFKPLAIALLAFFLLIISYNSSFRSIIAGPDSKLAGHPGSGFIRPGSIRRGTGPNSSNNHSNAAASNPSINIDRQNKWPQLSPKYSNFDLENYS